MTNVTLEGNCKSKQEKKIMIDKAKKTRPRPKAKNVEIIKMGWTVGYELPKKRSNDQTGRNVDIFKPIGLRKLSQPKEYVVCSIRVSPNIAIDGTQINPKKHQIYLSRSNCVRN